jgi:rhamnosyltransferase subunit B
MHALLVALGSHGDVHPFVGIGLGLRARGHRVTIIANEHFQPLIERVGLEFAASASDAHYRGALADPLLWDSKRATPYVLRLVADQIRPVYEEILKRYVPGETVVAAGSLGFGARIAQDAHGIPTATIHLQPLDFRSAHEFPAVPGVGLPRRMPKWGRRLAYRLIDMLVIDRHVCPAINALRAELGLGKISRLLNGWWNSPTRVLGLFPDWFAPPQPDWPAQTVLTGFPLYDEAGITPMDAELSRFLETGEKPVAFTPGSAMWQGHAFFATAAEACRSAGVRGILLSRYPDHIPQSLPPGVIHVPYAPFSELLPHCAALVHHGGIGTSAQALGAGVPQILMPMSHDQPDNAARLSRAGVARVLPPRIFTTERLARTLKDLLADPEVRQACARLAAKVRESDGVAAACDQIEGLAFSPAPSQGALTPGEG